MQTANDIAKHNTFTDDEITKIVELKRKAESVMVKIGYNSHMVLAGGAFTSWLQGSKLKDIDIFVLNAGSFGDKIYNDIYEQIDIKFFEARNVTSDYVRDNKNVTEVWNAWRNDDSYKYQFIFTKFKTREELIANFDYVHCMVSYHNYNLYITRQSFDAIMKKHLIVNNENQVKEWRKQKFVDRGFVDPDSNEMTAEQFNNMIRQPVSGSNWMSAARINPMRRTNIVP